jgi:hypothetical protein
MPICALSAPVGHRLKKNGYVLEQVFSPLVVHTTPEHAELKEIAKECITKHPGPERGLGNLG